MNENYEELAKSNRELNERYLSEFEEYLIEKGLTEKTIRNHVFSAQFYIDDFLTYYDVIPAVEGHSEIGEFLGDWFIRKAMWSSVSSIKGTAASIKKFYLFMLENKYIDEGEYGVLLHTIKCDMDIWIENLMDYESGEYGFANFF